MTRIVSVALVLVAPGLAAAPGDDSGPKDPLAAEIARAFGDLGGRPTLFLFDGSGRRVETCYGAPRTLHAAAEARIQSVL